MTNRRSMSLRWPLLPSVVALIVIACSEAGPASQPASAPTLAAAPAATPVTAVSSPIAVARPAATGTATTAAAAPRVAATIIAPYPSPAPLPTVGKAPPDKKIGLAFSRPNNAFSMSMRNGAQRAAQRAGVQLVVAEAASDNAQQADELSNLFSQHVDVILVDAPDSDAVAPSVQKANAAKVPVVVLGRVPKGGTTAAFVGSSDRNAGRNAAQLLNQAVSRGAKLAMLVSPDASGAADRASGFSEALRDPLVNSQGMTLTTQAVVNLDRAEAAKVTQSILAATPDIAGIFGQSDELALGAIQAIKASGMSGKVPVVGIDGTADAVSAIKAGEMYGTVAAQPDVMAEVAVASAVEILNGVTSPSPIDVPWRLVTRAEEP